MRSLCFFLLGKFIEFCTAGVHLFDAFTPLLSPLTRLLFTFLCLAFLLIIPELFTLRPRRATLLQHLAHATAQIGTFIGKTRQLTTAVGKKHMAQQVTQRGTRAQGYCGRHGESCGRCAYLGKTPHTQRSAGNPTQNISPYTAEHTHQRTQHERRKRQRNHPVTYLHGDPLVHVVFTFTQEPPTGNGPGAQRNRQARIPDPAQALRDSTQHRKERKIAHRRLRPAHMRVNAERKPGAGSPRHRVDHQVRKVTQLQQGHRERPHRPGVKFLVDCCDLRPAHHHGNHQHQSTAHNERENRHHGGTHNRPHIGARPPRVLAHLRNLFSGVHAHHTGERTRFIVAAPDQPDQHHDLRNQRRTNNTQQMPFGTCPSKSDGSKNTVGSAP